MIADDKTIGIAPMLDVTNREFRQLFRILSKRVTLWTEMVVDDTILHCENLDHHLYFDPNTHPIVLQLGGSDPTKIRRAVHKALEYGYDEININMGCPSSLVTEKACFGAILMKKIDVAIGVVKSASEAMSTTNTTNNTTTTTTRLSVKCRVGVDDLDSLEYMIDFIDQLRPYVKVFYLHARKCVLGGIFSTRQNRDIPPLNYPRVYELCNRFPDCEFYINGGIPNLKVAKELCFTSTNHSEEEGGEGDDDNNQHHHQVPCERCKLPNGGCIEPLPVPPPNLRGCLIGRAARDRPRHFWEIDTYFYGEATNPCRNRLEVVTEYLKYLENLVPRRCCDSDPRETRTVPPPFSIDHEYSCCPLCVDFVSPNQKENMAPDNYNPPKGTKISSYVYSRCLRPLIGILSGVPRSKTFRREFDRMMKTRDGTNCGPAIIIRRSLAAIDQVHLEKEFDSTEEMFQ